MRYDNWNSFMAEQRRSGRAVVDSADVALHFILWGKHAKTTFERVIGVLRKTEIEGISTRLRRRSDGPTDHVSATFSPHPSPLSADRGFFGSRPFSRANLALRLNNPGFDCQVDWRLP